MVTQQRKRIITGAAVCLTVLFALATSVSSPTLLLSSLSNAPRKKLGVFDEIFVIHLPHRSERWEEMETLRTGMGAEWDYVDGVLHTESLVSRILQRIRWERSSFAKESHESLDRREELKSAGHAGGHGLVAPTQFSLQELFDVDAQSTDTNFKLAGSDLWELDASDPRSADSTNPLGPIGEDDGELMLVGGVTEKYLQKHKTLDEIESSRWLSRGMVACWLSHLRALRQAAVTHNSKVLLLEDDVDMEWNLQDILENEWVHLPADWDMVFLGHCWSNETTFPAVLGSSRIHPSSSPECTHAYAVSQRGALKLLRHLRSPHFAFSRAIDQAFSFLIENKRMNAYSFAPSVVVQTKKSVSDVWAGGGKGSGYKAELEDSAIDRIVRGM